ncbi:MAG: hypothetical protein LJE92_00400 [Gammaproteobacteria bacterium]|nr:hypothetical protein [Gammaproteobacteria bacterium]
MTQKDSNRLEIDQLTAARRQHGLTRIASCEHLLERIDDARINCNACIGDDANPLLTMAERLATGRSQA